MVNRFQGKYLSWVRGKKWENNTARAEKGEVSGLVHKRINLSHQEKSRGNFSTLRRTFELF